MNLWISIFDGHDLKSDPGNGNKWAGFPSEKYHFVPVCSIVVMPRTGSRDETDPSCDETDPSCDATDPIRDVTDNSCDATDRKP